jgi:hypothetical protein
MPKHSISPNPLRSHIDRTLMLRRQLAQKMHQLETLVAKQLGATAAEIRTEDFQSYVACLIEDWQKGEFAEPPIGNAKLYDLIAERHALEQQIRG